MTCEVKFPKLQHYWFDSGLIGLNMILEEDSIGINKEISDDGLTLIGSEEEIQEVLERAYDLLIKKYYNISSKKQIDEISKYNFYYDSKGDKFIAFPKKKAVGIAKLIFDKAARPSISSVNWAKKDIKRDVIIDGKSVKKNRPLLPPSYNSLQQRMEDFLDENGLDVTTSGLLLDGPNIISPNVKIQVKPGKSKGNCYFCGNESNTLEDVSQTTFPFITGSSGVLSFNSQGSSPEKVCWKCSFIGKFVPVNGFYLSNPDSIFAFFPYSTSFEKMRDVFLPLQDAKYFDANYFTNFENPLGGYFQRPFEVSFAFFYAVYKKVILHQQVEGDDQILNWEDLCEITLSRAPLEFVVLHAESKGQTSIGKLVWPFRDSVYFFRLMEKLENNGLSIKELSKLLIDFSQKKNENKTILRNRVCERILRKRSTLDLIESHCFRSEISYIKLLLDFVIIYEPIIRKGVGGMTVDEQGAAVTLGKRIGMTVGKDGKKGDLFALRKARRKTDFLNELNRLQFKCNLTVPPDVYEGKLTDLNFIEFKQFCMIAALNSYQAASHNEKGGKQ
ncbi:MAG: hypothetical protein AB2L14_19940 [Candidatus Xenobiia bacterium LiM19]